MNCIIIDSRIILSHVRRRAIIWTNGYSLPIEIMRTNFGEVLRTIPKSFFKKKHFRMSSVKCRPLCTVPIMCWCTHEHLTTVHSSLDVIVVKSSWLETLRHHWFDSLLVTQYGVRHAGQRWFKQWRGVYSVPTHNLGLFITSNFAASRLHEILWPVRCLTTHWKEALT